MADSIELLVAALAKEMQNSPSLQKKTEHTRQPELTKAIGNNKRTYTAADYPMLEKHGEEIRTPTGKKMNEITIDNVVNGKLSINDVRISKEMLYAQSQIADDAKKPALGENLKRAAELIQVPDDKVISMYNMLRPNRSTKEQLSELASSLENDYHAPMCAKLVREAAEVYEKRNILLK